MRWGLIVLLGCASGLSAFGMASVVPVLPLLGRALAAPFSEIQFVVSAYLLGLGLCQPIQGLLCDRFGRRPVLLVGFAVFCFGSIVAASVNSLAALIAARFLQAAGASVATVVTRAIVRDSFEPEPAAVALAFITAVMGLSPVIAPLAGALVADAFGWRSVFWMHAVIACSLLLWMSLSLRETRPKTTAGLTLVELLRGFGVLLRERSFLGYSFTYAFVSGASFVFVTVGAALFDRLFGISPTRFGALWAGLAVAYMLGAAATGTVARRLGSARVLRFGVRLEMLGAVLLCGVALLPTPQLWLYMLGLALLMAANGVVSPLALAGAVSGRPELAGIASGASSAIAMLVSMLCAITAGILFNGEGLRIGVLLLICCALAMVAARMALTASVPQGRRT